MGELKPELKTTQDPFAVELRNNLAKKMGFRYVGCFDEENMAFAVKGDGMEIKFLINKKGETIAGPFFHIQPFKEGLARIRKDDTGYYFINREGKEVIGPFKGIVSDFKDGVIRVFCNAHEDFFNKNGEKIKRDIEGYKPKEIPPKEKTWPITEYRNGGFYFINKEGKEIAGPFNNVNPFKEGLALVNVKKEGEPYGENYYIDKEGKIKLGPYDAKRGFDFNEGVAVVLTDQRKAYYIDHNGKKVFE